MEGGSNRGMLYHEVQESNLCAVHCVNTVLQGPFFSEFDLAALASDLDTKERQMMFQGTAAASPGGFLSEESHNVSLGGDFSIQGDCDLMTCRTQNKSIFLSLFILMGILLAAQISVLQKALEVWDLQVISLDCPVAESAQIDPELENAFICHLNDHWFCIRKVNGEWYNFNSLYTAPEHFSKFYLSAYLDSLKGSGWSIFLVRGNFPKEFPIFSSEAFNGYGQWLSPEDAKRITKSCNLIQAPHQRNNTTQQHPNTQMLLDTEDEDLKAAITASLMDSSPATASAEADNPKTDDENKIARKRWLLDKTLFDNGSCQVLDFV